MTGSEFPTPSKRHPDGDISKNGIRSDAEISEKDAYERGDAYTDDDLLTEEDEYEGENGEEYDEEEEYDDDDLLMCEEEYDFNGIDHLEDTERLDDLLRGFRPENWKEMSMEERKELIAELFWYVIDITGIRNPPKTVYYDEPPNRNSISCGTYSCDDNAVRINEWLFDNRPDLVFDTVVHELWHAYQHQCAEDPRCPRGELYRDGFENYREPKYGHEAYENQMVEAEARAFAERFKDRFNKICGGR